MKILTIGLPVYDDFNGIYFSVQAIRYYHAEVMPYIQIIIIDNAPHTKAGEATRYFAENIPDTKYIAHTATVGPAGAKNAVFDYAETEFVMCMDSHVFIEPGALRKLLDYFTFVDRQGGHLYQGPLLHDALEHVSTHFQPGWSTGMYGTWATDERHKGSEPFDIPMQGMGLFACRRDAWLGFNRDFKGFGAEEGYIHEKFRLHGQRALCLPWLRWLHRFGRPSGVEYAVLWEDRIRNYLIGWHETKQNLASILEHFSSYVNIDITKNCYENFRQEFHLEQLPDFASYNILPSPEKLPTRDIIRQKLSSNKISYVQIDPVGDCNASCWYCPVRYESLPESTKKHMSITDFEKILQVIISNKGGLVDSNFAHIFTAHYSEILLYQFFPEMLELLRKYSLKMTLQSNAIALTPEKISLITQYQDVISDISLNIPAGEATVWAKYTGLPSEIFQQIEENLDYLVNHANQLLSITYIQVNGLDERSCQGENATIIPLKFQPISDFSEANGELTTQTNLLKQRWPALNIGKNPFLSDRTGLLELHQVISQEKIINKQKGKGTRVVGCNNLNPGRPFGWLHINSVGDVFLCCNDYHYLFTIGNLLQSPLENFWITFEHISLIEGAFENFCKNCCHAEWLGAS